MAIGVGFNFCPFLSDATCLLNVQGIKIIGFFNQYASRYAYPVINSLMVLEMHLVERFFIII